MEKIKNKGMLKLFWVVLALSIFFGGHPVYAAVTGTADRASAPLIYQQNTSVALEQTGTYFKFVPTENATYTMASSGSSDAFAELQDSFGNPITSGDDENFFDFVITWALTAGETYYLFMYDYDMPVTCTLSITGGGLQVPNTAPLLTPAAPTMTAISEDDTSNGGQTVESIVGTSITDADAGALEGIAITSISGSGTWQYSTNGGASWSAIGAVAGNSALLLGGPDRIRFIPDGQNEAAGSITYRAWDRTSGAQGSYVDTATNGGTTAFSTATDAASIDVYSVNDAPLITADTPDLTAINEDDVNNSGQSAASFIGATISDVDSWAVEGIAITSVTSGAGTWQYSTDNGGTWTAIGAVSDGSALLLRPTDKIRFVPDGQNQTTGSLTYRAWDQTSGTPGNKVDTIVNGGTTAFSTATDTASINVTAVNDAPVLTAQTPTLTTLSASDTNNAGQTVASFIGTSITDVDSGAMEGVAITAVASGNGAWQYSLDNGGTWTSIGAVVANNALFLRDTDKIRFVPDGQNPTTGSITYRAWDRTSGAQGFQADTTTNGGTTAFSTATDTASITINEAIPPTINSATRASNTQITVTLSENCIDLNKGNDGGFVIQETGASGTTYAVTGIAQGADAAHVVLTVADMSSSAKEGVTVKYTAGGNGTVQDEVGNPMATDAVGVAVAAWDTTAPVVTSVTVPPNGTYAAGYHLDFIVNFDEAVSVNTAGGIPYIPLTLDTGVVNADYLSGTGTTALQFRYTVQAGDLDTNGIEAGAAISPNGATAADIAGNNAVLDLNNIGSTTAVLADGASPSITSVTVPANGTYLAGQSLHFTVNFDEAVTVFGATPYIPLTLDTGGVVRADYLIGSGSTALTFRYTVQAGNLDTNGIDVGTEISLNGAEVRDAVGNNAAITLNNMGSTTAVLVDGIVPNVTSVTVPANGTYVAGQNLDFTVKLDEAVTVNTSGGTPHLTLVLDTGGTVNASYVSGTGTSALVFRYTIAEGNLDFNGIALGAGLSLNGGSVQDAAGNDVALTLNGIGSTTGVLVDAVAPTVMSLNPADNGAGIGLNDNLVINFTENVAIGSGNIAIHKTSDDSLVEAISVTGGQVTGNGTDTITVNPSITLEYLTGYYIQIDATAFSDAAGNSFAGIGDKTTWNFTTIPSSNADLSNLTISSGVFSPVFSSDTTTYTISVGNGITSINVTPTTAGAGTTIEVNGSLVASGTPSQEVVLNVGANNIAIEVTAQDGATTKVYTVVVTRAPSSAKDVTAVTVPAGATIGTDTITASVPNDSASVVVDLTASPEASWALYTDSGCTIEIVNKTLGLAVGANTAYIEVTAQDGTTKAYTLTITRAPSSNADLAGLTLSYVTLNPVFASGTTSYTASVANSVYQTAITATISDATATMKINGIEALSGQPLEFVDLTVGSNTVAVTVYAQDGTTTKTYEITITRANPPSSSGSSNNDNEPTDENTIENVGDAEKTIEDDRTVTTVTVDEAKLEEQLNRAPEKTKVILPVKDSSDVVVGQLNGKTVKKMEDKEAILEVKTDRVTYTIPAAQINIDSVSAQIGKQVELKDIQVKVKITEPKNDAVKVVEDIANKGKYQLILKPVEFEIECTNGQKTVQVSKFNNYVERMVAVPEGVDPNKITTGVVLNADGTFSHVPTVITKVNGKYYAKINSLTNSTYATIWNEKQFADVENHWSKEAVNDMGSRLVINGYEDENFKPNKEISRAEFAAIIVNALGLRDANAEVKFSDVSPNSWYYEKVRLAYEYGIVSGYSNGTYKPGKKITREEAMAMIAKAMEIAKLDTGVTTQEITEELEKFSDAGQVADWAKELSVACVQKGIVSGYNGKLNPKHNITRAETAVVVSNVLKEAELI